MASWISCAELIQWQCQTADLHAGAADVADPTDSRTRNNLYSLQIKVLANALIH